MFHPDQAYLKSKYRRITWMACVKLPVNINEIYAIIDIQMLNVSHNFLSCLSCLDNERTPDIEFLNREGGDVFSEFCAEIFK